jgi:hypothetical protein
MKILVDIDGVMMDESDSPIPTGVKMVGSLSANNQIYFISRMTEPDLIRWLNINKIVDFDGIIDPSVKLADEDLSIRQINVARSKGQADLFITNSPTLWAYSFRIGIPSVLFSVPSYTRVEFRPDAPRKVRAWSEVEATIAEQNALRTQDARLTRTEGINFE